MKLHLGCGHYYLEGYTNVDYPPSEHSVQQSIKADLFCDLATLRYPAGSVEEIRLHHVFEHFPRPAALALLCRWRDWLVPGGTLRIETPDLLASAWLLVSPLVTYAEKQEVIRHLFGSHESHWAAHWDGWYPRRFERTLTALGFEITSISRTKWARLRNVEVMAQKTRSNFSTADYREAARKLLALSTVKSPPGLRSYLRKPSAEILSASESEMLEVWMRAWEQAYVA